MFTLFFKNTVFLLLSLLFSYAGLSNYGVSSIKTENNSVMPTNSGDSSIVVGANRTAEYVPKLKNKNVAVLGNQTSVIFKDNGYTHLVDSLVASGINVTKIFSPEHGFRGTASAGETVENGMDKKTGLPVVSLYGDHRKPTEDDLNDVDILVFDIQDVGARFYTYLSTLHYIMEASAENNIPLIILDRPNPNGNYVDGPILEKEHQSFVGMDPVPIVHGMTIGEYAQMINGEGWLPEEEKADLEIIKMKHYSKDSTYSLPINPSPNLPNDQAINFYPSLALFEGTNVNAGRGTDQQFQVFGSPFLDKDYFDYHYTPESKEGAKHPKHQDETCYGRNLQEADRLNQINLKWLIEAYEHTEDPDDFFNDFFIKLAGTSTLQEQIEDGLSAEDIRSSWKPDLTFYNEMRQPYLLY